MNNRTVYLKRTISVSAVIIVIVLGFYLYLPPVKSPVKTMDNTIGVDHLDILCVGSSHMYMGINPLQLYQDKGYAAYDIAMGSQAPWQSYYYIKEACRNQDPKLIIFDTYSIGSYGQNATYKDYQTVSNLVDNPMSLNKAEALFASDADSKLSIFLTFPYRYDDVGNYPGLTLEKYVAGKNILMGYKGDNTTEPCEEVLDVTDITESLPVHPKNEKYLRLIIEYCRDNDIDLLLTNTPWPCITEETQKYFNYIGEIAAEYDVPFINGCLYYKEMGIDYMTDNYGNSGHLNHSGITKYNIWLEDYLEQNYDLPDHRREEDYAVYEEGIEYLNEKLSDSGDNETPEEDV